MPKKKRTLPKELNTVTSTSKVFAAVIFIVLPFVFFYLGMQYGQTLTEIENAPTERCVEVSE